MKITLNDSIPTKHRSKVEAIVNAQAPNSEVLWLPSRFPRYVMLVEPGTQGPSEPQHDSIFDSMDTGVESISSLTQSLEHKIKSHLKASSSV